MASTEELRQAMIHYRAMFEDLLGAGRLVDAGPSETDVPSQRRS